MSHIIVASMLNAVIYSQLVSNGYRSSSVQDFYPDCNLTCVESKSSLTYASFLTGGAIACFLNLLCVWNFKSASAPTISHILNELRKRIHLLSITLWWIGNVIIGYNYAGTSINNIAINTVMTPDLQYKFYVDSIINILFVDIAGGVFFWGTVGKLIHDIHLNVVGVSSIFVATILTPVVAIIINLSWENILAPQGGYLYAYRLIAVIVAPLYIFRVLSFRPEDTMVSKTKGGEYVILEDSEGSTSEGGVKSPRSSSVSSILSARMKSSRLSLISEPSRVEATFPFRFKKESLYALTLTNTLIFQLFYFIPFVVLPKAVSQTTTSSNTTVLNYLFGGMILARVLAASFIYLQYSMSRYLNPLQKAYTLIMVGMGWTPFALFMVWNSAIMDTFPFANLAFVFGLSTSMIDVHQVWGFILLHRGGFRDAKKIALVVFGIVFVSAIGAFILMSMIGDIWITNSHVVTQAMSGIFAVLFMGQMMLELK